MADKTYSYSDCIKKLKSLGTPKRAKASSWFFKTGKGQYGEGDVFLGITVPDQRKVAHRFQDLSLSDIKKLLNSPVHEHRFVALEILVFRYEKGNGQEKKKIGDFYLANTNRINNWDLVDTSAPYILGDYLLKKDKRILYKFARSKNIWERRIAVITAGTFVKSGNYRDLIKISEMLLKDKHDLIHKATGWMLRELGKISPEAEIEFLDKYYHTMPRTMLRYAIEKFSPERRRHYLQK